MAKKLQPDTVTNDVVLDVLSKDAVPGTSDVIAPGPTALQQSDERLKREDETSFSDYVKSAYRQDSFVDGLIGHFVGQDFQPVEGYNPFDKNEWAELSEGIADDYLPYLYDATSPQQARFIRSRIIDKQQDLQRLGDLGVAGNIGRFALGAVAPENFAMGLVGGWVARGAKAAQTAQALRRAKAATTTLDKAKATEELARVTAALNARNGSAAAIGSGIVAGGAGNAAVEKLRQSVNFEDDSAMLVEAFLLGSAFTTPFALWGARSYRRTAAAANAEAETLHTLRKAAEGAPLTPEETTLVSRMADIHDTVKKIESGEVPPEVGVRTIDELLHGDDQARYSAARNNELLKAQADQMLRERVERGMTGEQPMIRNTRSDLPRRDAAGPDAPSPMAQKLAAALFRKKQDDAKKAEAAKADAAAAPKVSKEDAFARMEAEQAAQRERDVAAAEAGSDLFAAYGPRSFDFVYSAKKGGIVIRERIGDRAQFEELEGVYKDAAEAREYLDGLLRPRDELSPEEAVGTDVFFTGYDGDLIAGSVVGYQNGRLQIDGADGRIHYMTRGELDPQSPLFKFDDVPEGFLPGSAGAAQVAPIANPVAVGMPGSRGFIDSRSGKLVRPRYDIYSWMASSENTLTRELARILVKDPIAESDVDAQAWTASERKSHLMRTVRGGFHATAREAFLEASKVRGWNLAHRVNNARDFYERVSDATRGLIRPEDQDIAPMLQKAATAQRKAYEELLQAAKDAGVEGADTVAPDAMYVNRIWNHERLREAVEKHGETGLVQTLADSFTDPAGLIKRFKDSPEFKANPISDPEILRLKAKRFLKAVRKLEYTPALREFALRSGADARVLEEMLKDVGLGSDEIREIKDVMFAIPRQGSEPDAGRAGNLRFRAGFDETLEHTNGLRVRDLFENDSRVLVDLYAESLAGHTGLAKVGFPERADFNRYLNDIAEEASNKGLDPQRTQEEIELARDLYAHIVGMPNRYHLESRATLGRVAMAARGWTRSATLGQLGLAAAFELKQAIALTSMRAMLAHMPTLGQFFSALRMGRVPNKQLARDIEQMVGFGHEMASGYARQYEIAEGFYDRGLTRFESVTNKVSHTVDVLSGNASFTSLTRQWAGMGFVQHHNDFARGRKKITDAQRDRWVAQGVDRGQIDLVLEHLKDYTDVDPSNGAVVRVRWKDWSQDQPATYERYQLMLSREVRDAIQDHDIGETMPWMHSTLGKVLAELRTFYLVAHAKNFLKNGHFRDMTTFRVWSIGFVGEMMAYSLQQTINYGHDPEELAKRLEPDRIALSAFARMAAAGTLPFLLETPYSVVTGGDSLFQPGATTNTDNRNFLMTPSLSVASKMLTAAPTLGGAILGTDTTTGRELKNALQWLPGSNLWVMRSLLDSAASQLPTRELDNQPR